MSDQENRAEIEKLLESLPDQPGIEAYKSDEMITCVSCDRANPPNRLECLYCGVDLEISEEQGQLIKPTLRKTENWKEGISLIFRGGKGKWSETQLAEASKMTRLNAQVLMQIVETGKPLPLARVESKTELEIAKQRFGELGIETFLFDDENFDLESVSNRLRTIEFIDDTLRLTYFNHRETVEIDKKELFLVVIGARFERKIESTENYKRKGDNKLVETTELSADQMLIDFYTKRSQVSYQIEANGFDFSFLGDQKALVVNENMSLLIRKLKEFAPEAIFDEDYLSVRSSLSQVWDPEEKTDSKGIQRKGFGKFNREQIMESDNLAQFTKYSRLQWHLLHNTAS
ncbi:MAG: hypothetical protein HKN25_13820 [Pyrinomonadaceae bacterium]|nr:hypothetical protein [Pyrinomonadaceae bacterium]